MNQTGSTKTRKYNQKLAKKLVKVRYRFCVVRIRRAAKPSAWLPVMNGRLEIISRHRSLLSLAPFMGYLKTQMDPRALLMPQRCVLNSSRALTTVNPRMLRKRAHMHTTKPDLTSMRSVFSARSPSHRRFPQSIGIPCSPTFIRQSQQTWHTTPVICGSTPSITSTLPRRPFLRKTGDSSSPIWWVTLYSASFTMTTLHNRYRTSESGGWISAGGSLRNVETTNNFKRSNAMKGRLYIMAWAVELSHIKHLLSIIMLKLRCAQSCLIKICLLDREERDLELNLQIQHNFTVPYK